MSEIIKKINASSTGQRYANYSLVSAETKINKPVEMAFLTEYFVGVKLGHTVRVDDDQPHQKEEAIRAIERAMTELIFGEFRSLLAKANYSLYNRDFEAAKRAIEEIDQRMFYESNY